MGDFDLRAIRRGVAEKLRTVTGLKAVYPYVVDRAESTPAAYVAAGEPLDFNARYGRGHVRVTLRVVVVCGRVELDAAQAILDLLLSQLPLEDLDESGPEGVPVTIKDALEIDQTLFGTCQTVNVARAENLRAVTIAGVDYLAVDLVVVIDT